MKDPNAQYYSKQWQRRFFRSKKNGNWVENACSKCGRGMMKHIYDFQLENRGKQNIICSTCSRKEDKKALKELSI